MSWLRIDDQRCLHPKVGDLTDREYRALDALYEYCARTGNGGYYRLFDLRHAVYATPAGPRSPSRLMNAKWTATGLVDHLEGESYRVHDWDDYQPKDPTGAQRKRLERERKTSSPHDTVHGLSQDNHVTGHTTNRDSRVRGPSRPVPNPSLEERQTSAVDVAPPFDEQHTNESQEGQEPFDIDAMTALVADSLREIP